MIKKQLIRFLKIYSVIFINKFIIVCKTKKFNKIKKKLYYFVYKT